MDKDPICIDFKTAMLVLVILLALAGVEYLTRQPEVTGTFCMQDDEPSDCVTYRIQPK